MSGINWENAIDVEDYVAAPASEAYVERIFSFMLSTGKRNRMSKSLEMRVFLKINAKIVEWGTGDCTVLYWTVDGSLTTSAAQ